MKKDPTLRALGSAGSSTIDLRRRTSITACRVSASEGAAMPRSAKWRLSSAYLTAGVPPGRSRKVTPVTT